MKQWWLWALLFALMGLFVYILVQQVVFGKPVGNNPAPNGVLILLSLIPLGVMALVYSVTLKTEVTDTEIKINLTPLGSATIKRSEIKTSKIVYYGFVGYGLRFSPKYGTVYNTHGKVGMAIETNNGSKYLIGTQKATEFEKALKK